MKPIYLLFLLLLIGCQDNDPVVNPKDKFLGDWMFVRGKYNNLGGLEPFDTIYISTTDIPNGVRINNHHNTGLSIDTHYSNDSIYSTSYSQIDTLTSGAEGWYQNDQFFNGFFLRYGVWTDINNQQVYGGGLYRQ